jgi:hypothetical protein
MKKAELRGLVLEGLRKHPEADNLVAFDRVMRDMPGYQRSDALLMREILWELFMQGVLAPGMNSANLDFPWFHTTEYGGQCIQASMLLPHDPDGYIMRLQEMLGQPLDSIMLTYLQEALQTFLGGQYLASTVMLGVASERCIDLLNDCYLKALTGHPNEKASVAKKLELAGRSVKRRFDILRSELLALPLPPDLLDALDIQLSGIFTLIRYSRNDAGHPTGQTVDQEVVHGNLILFPHYCKRVYALMDHISSNPI